MQPAKRLLEYGGTLFSLLLGSVVSVGKAGCPARLACPAVDSSRFVACPRTLEVLRWRSRRTFYVLNPPKPLQSFRWHLSLFLRKHEVRRLPAHIFYIPHPKCVPRYVYTCPAAYAGKNDSNSLLAGAGGSPAPTPPYPQPLRRAGSPGLGERVLLVGRWAVKRGGSTFHPNLSVWFPSLRSKRFWVS